MDATIRMCGSWRMEDEVQLYAESEAEVADEIRELFLVLA